MSLTARLLARLRAEGLAIPEGARVERTRAGRHQRSAGAWSWYLLDADGSELNIASQWPVGELVKAARITAGHQQSTRDTHIFPWQVPSARSKVRDIRCTGCDGSGRATVEVTSGPCFSCSGFGWVSEHDLAECWCDGTPEATSHASH